MARSVRLTALCLVTLAGCAGLVFTESDRGQVREVDAGSVFTISLPSQGKWRAPEVVGSCIQFLSRRREEADGSILFEFRAEIVGSSKIVISSDGIPGAGGDFTLHVRVLKPMMPPAPP